MLRSFRGSLGLPVRPALDVPHVSRVQMVEIDRSTMEDFGISLIQMMENAGALLADLTRRSLGGSVEGSRITVLAGRGHNGGGGLVAARRLHLMGAHLDVLLAAEPDQYSGVPGLQTQIITNLGMTPRIYQGEPLADSDIVLDA
ncbi:MAG: NAD(P)H-hydrate epimerase, partial [Dehalococcoidia bacterium]